MNSPVSILPTDTKVNPARPETADEPDYVGEVLYILSKPERTRPTRVVSSAGLVGDRFAIGKTNTYRHDQTWAKLGDYTTVGIVNTVTGKSEGEVPNRVLALSVFK